MTRIVSCSDLHLGHQKVNATYMTESYKKMIYPLLKDADMFFIVGDVFHTDISLTEARSVVVMSFLQDLLRKCAEENVLVRITQGTFSHDRNQLDHLTPLWENLQLKNDFRVIKEMSVETLPNGFQMLYIPDDLPFANSDDLVTKAKEIMEEAGMETVDYALVHGAFDFCGIPANAQPKITFRVDQFDFVKKLVLTGHIHTPYKKKHVVYHGSLERMAHNEEEDKGLIVVDDPDNGDTPKWKFIVNHDASIFRKFDDKDIPVEDILKVWRERFEDLPRERLSYLRMVHPDVGIRRAVEKLSRSYGHVYFDDVAPKDDTKEFCVQKIDDGVKRDFYVPTQETIARDLLSYIKKEDPTTQLTEEKLEAYMKRD